MSTEPGVEGFVRRILGRDFDRLVETMLDLAVPPVYLGHDWGSRLKGVLEHCETRLTAALGVATGEVDAIVSSIPDVIRSGRDALDLLELATRDQYFAIPATLLRKPRPESRVFKALPRLYTRVDDDGLISVADTEPHPQAIFVDEYALHYHQLLRRGFGSHVNYELTAALIAQGLSDGSALRIAVDERRLRAREEFVEVFERDFWRGPALSDAVLDDPRVTGTTVHGDPEGGRSILNPFPALFVRWTVDGDLKTCEIEEMARVGDEGEPVLVRYLHAIRDTAEGNFIHLDGAVKSYPGDGYPRAPADFPPQTGTLAYRKVFRLDGTIATDAWGQIAALWFRGNPLILEYLATLSP